MKKLIPLLLSPILLFNQGCNTSSHQGSKDQWKSEILKAEADFAEMVQKEGIPKGFIAFAADSVVVNRNDSLIIGKAALQDSYKDYHPTKKVSLTWKPDFVDVSASGDLGYTYGKYLYTVTDSTGDKKEYRGVFHTVWKKQADGNWRFVWD